MKSLIIAIALLTFGIKVSAFDWKAQPKVNAGYPSLVSDAPVF